MSTRLLQRSSLIFSGMVSYKSGSTYCPYYHHRFWMHKKLVICQPLWCPIFFWIYSVMMPSRTPLSENSTFLLQFYPSTQSVAEGRRRWCRHDRVQVLESCDVGWRFPWANSNKSDSLVQRSMIAVDGINSDHVLTAPVNSCQGSVRTPKQDKGLMSSPGQPVNLWINFTNVKLRVK